MDISLFEMQEPKILTASQVFRVSKALATGRVTEGSVQKGYPQAISYPCGLQSSQQKVSAFWRDPSTLPPCFN